MLAVLGRLAHALLRLGGCRSGLAAACSIRVLSLWDRLCLWCLLQVDWCSMLLQAGWCSMLGDAA